MSKNIFMGGFMGAANYIAENASNFPGVYNVGDRIRLARAGSDKGSVAIGWINKYSDSSIPNSGTIYLPAGANHVFLSIAGGAGSGAHDNDCNGQGPGGAGGAGKFLISLSAVNFRQSVGIPYIVGSGGNGTGGNDVWGNAGNLSYIAIDNFSVTANGGEGGRAKNGGGNAGPSGNLSITGPYVSYTTSSFASSPAVVYGDLFDGYQYGTMPTTSAGSPGQCGNPPSAPGTEGCIYIRYGFGITGSTTLTPSDDPPSSGFTQAYTPDYS
jgi:hypothetical protein